MEKGPKKGTKRNGSEDGSGKKRIKKEASSKISSPDSTAPGTASGTATGQGAVHPITHRPVTSCTHCRQHKIKCDASQNFPAPCTRCEKNGFHCEINPQFRPKKGSMMQMLAHEVDDLKYKVSYLIRNEGIVARALAQYQEGKDILEILSHNPPGYYQEGTKNSTHKTSNPHSLSSPASNATAGTPGHDMNMSSPSTNTKISVQTYLAGEHPLVRQDTKSPILSGPNSVGAAPISGTRNSLVNGKFTNSVNKPILPPILNDSTPTNNASKSQLNASLLQLSFHNKGTPVASSPSTSRARSPSLQQSATPHSIIGNDYGLQQAGQISAKRSPIVATTTTMDPLPSPHANIDEFVLGDIRLPITKADELHDTFVTKYLPYFPIMTSNSATELYGQSQLLFWTVMLTASLSDPEPTLYTQLASLIKQLAIETCWIRTPRSTHISQALLILCIWPLPNQKVLDDCSYRFVGLARTLSYQLGLHRGEFIYEFTRTQTSMPDAEKWRTRTWLGIFFADLCWSSILGLPPTSQPDYLTEKAKASVNVEDDNKKVNGIEKSQVEDPSTMESSNGIKRDDANTHSRNITLPSRFKALILLTDFQGKLSKIMGSSVTSPDGMMEPSYRADALAVLEKELEDLNVKNNFETDDVVNIYYLYVKLTIYCFAFLPGTPIQDQLNYVNDAYVAATKIVTLLTKLLKHQQLVELPIYIRQSATYAALILFKLQLSPALSDKCFESARQSIVTVHRFYRNQLSAWATAVENDISRTASMLEKLNFVLITHPEVLVEEEGIISRMRSHLTGSLFYDLVWCVHEARRREVDPEYNKQALANAKEKRKERGGDSPGNILESKLYPLPLYNQISKEDFKTVTKTTPNGTTVTTLVPTRSALRQAENNSSVNGNAVVINGIPLAMLDENGSLDSDNLFALQNAGSQSNVDNSDIKQGTNGYPRMIDSLIRPEANELERPNSAMATVGTNEHTTTNLDTSIVPKPSKDDLAPYPNDISMERQTSFPPTQNPHTATSSVMSVPEIPKNGKSFKDLGGLTNWGALAPNQDGKQKSEELLPTSSRLQLNQLSDFFQQQSAGWIEGNLGNDDFFGWLDMNMEPKF